MSAEKKPFHILKECYQWSWVINHGTAFFETSLYEHPCTYHFLHHHPRNRTGEFDQSHSQRPAIALPPEIFLGLICGTETSPPMLHKIQQLASAFEEFSTGFPAVKGLSVDSLVLYHDHQRQTMGVISYQEFMQIQALRS